MAGYLPVDTPPGTAPMPLGKPPASGGGSGRFGGKQAPPFGKKASGGKRKAKHKPVSKGKSASRPPFGRR